MVNFEFHGNAFKFTKKFFLQEAFFEGSLSTFSKFTDSVWRLKGVFRYWLTLNLKLLWRSEVNFASFRY